MASRPLVLCVVDVPNLNGVTYEAGFYRPNWRAFADWFHHRFVPRLKLRNVEVVKKAFMNMPLDADEKTVTQRKKQAAELRRAGFEVEVLQKLEDSDDIDHLVKLTIKEYRVYPELASVVILSHDMKNLRGTVRELEVQGIPCTIVGLDGRIGRRHPFLSGEAHRIVDARRINGFLNVYRPRTPLSGAPR